MVIVQVERVVERHTIPTRHVHIPGILVDKVPPLLWRIGDVTDRVDRGGVEARMASTDIQLRTLRSEHLR